MIKFIVVEDNKTIQEKIKKLLIKISISINQDYEAKYFEKYNKELQKEIGYYKALLAVNDEKDNQIKYLSNKVERLEHDNNSFKNFLMLFLQALKERNYQKRAVGIIENGSWAPSAGKCMKNILSEMKNVEIVEPMVTIKSRMKNEDIASQ